MKTDYKFDAKDVGRQITSLRNIRRMSQEDLCKALAKLDPDMEPLTIEQLELIEQGELDFPMSTFIKMLEILGYRIGLFKA